MDWSPVIAIGALFGGIGTLAGPVVALLALRQGRQNGVAIQNIDTKVVTVQAQTDGIAAQTARMFEQRIVDAVGLAEADARKPENIQTARNKVTEAEATRAASEPFDTNQKGTAR